MVLSAVVLIAAAGCINIAVKVAQTTQTGPISGASPHPPSIGGGAFAPGQAPVPAGSTGQLLTGSPSCCSGVTTNKIAFEFDLMPPENSNFTQMAPLGTTSWQGYLTNLTTGMQILNTYYCLYLAADTLHTGCCTPVSGSSYDVSRNTWAGYHIRFTAYFKTGHEPNGGDIIKVVGDPGWR